MKAERWAAVTEGVIVFLIVIFVAGLPRAAPANMFQIQDANSVAAVAKEILNAEEDNLTASRSLVAEQHFDENDCLNQISNELDGFQTQLSEISTLIAISSVMSTSFDEITVLEYLRAAINAQTKFRQKARLLFNTIAGSGYCGRSVIVPARAQVALSLVSESERIVLPIQRRLGL